MLDQRYYTLRDLYNERLVQDIYVYLSMTKDEEIEENKLFGV